MDSSVIAARSLTPSRTSKWIISSRYGRAGLTKNQTCRRYARNVTARKLCTNQDSGDLLMVKRPPPSKKYPYLTSVLQARKALSNPHKSSGQFNSANAELATIRFDGVVAMNRQGSNKNLRQRRLPFPDSPNCWHCYDDGMIDIGNVSNTDIEINSCVRPVPPVMIPCPHCKQHISFTSETEQANLDALLGY